MHKTTYSNVWNLENLFHGDNSLHNLKQMIDNLETELKVYSSLQDLQNTVNIISILKGIGEIRNHLSQGTSFLTCTLAANPKDSNAKRLHATVSSLEARFTSGIKKFQSILLTIKQDTWNELVASEDLKDYRFKLQEWRKMAETFLPENEEKLVLDLMVDGYHGWGHFYQTLLSSIKVDVPIENETKRLSFGQALNLRSHPSEAVRKTAHYALENVWKDKEELVGETLNHLAGFRIEIYRKRGYESVLSESISENRLKQETLDAMWKAVSKHKQPFKDYLQRKASLLGHEKLQSYNFWAPLTSVHQTIEYEDAVDFILEHFGRFGPELASFTQHAFEHGWIEAWDRPNKSAAAFCANFPLSGESRIFSTYGNSMTSVLTLAHELGHAYHNYAMKPVDGVNRLYPLSIAETASTFAEQIILDAALEKSESPEDKLFLLDEKLKRSVMNFMNIHARFLFEESFYEERKMGIVSPTRLNELMLDAFDIAYEGSLEELSVHTWAWTPHFYITKSPFYNFPYTFGYLFSLSLYAKSKEVGQDFENNYIELLRDSGSMSAEDLVMKHLNEDITSIDFWEKGIQICVKDVEEFLNLTDLICTTKGMKI